MKRSQRSFNRVLSGGDSERAGGSDGECILSCKVQCSLLIFHCFCSLALVDRALWGGGDSERAAGSDGEYILHELLCILLDYGGSFDVTLSIERDRGGTLKRFQHGSFERRRMNASSAEM